MLSSSVKKTVSGRVFEVSGQLVIDIDCEHLLFEGNRFNFIEKSPNLKITDTKLNYLSKLNYLIY